MGKPIFVTKPSFAPFEEYVPLLQSIWDSENFTNNGPMVRRLESELESYLKVRNVVCVSNGTAALQLSLQALDLKGEVITTPFTFIATASSISWEHCKPVFVDICEDTWNIDSSKIEKHITDKTTCILPVHVFGAPCNINGISQISKQYNLKVIYDAAHAFGVNTGNCSITAHGDISCISFHATKIFNTVEGGACITNNDELAEKIRQMRYFGFNSNREIVRSGINAKMTEIHAAIGIVNLRNIENALRLRKKKHQIYTDLLRDIPIKFQNINHMEYNYSYMPAIFENKAVAEKVINNLSRYEIYPRGYFHPSLNTLEIFGVKEKFHISEGISERILCLPLYDDLPEDDILKICRIIRETV
jgi:dTDP-4-amino-4,6-dideoxygalactose transaminase